MIPEAAIYPPGLAEELAADPSLREHPAPHPPAPLELPRSLQETLSDLYIDLGVYRDWQGRLPHWEPTPTFRDIWCAGASACVDTGKARGWDGFGCYACRNARGPVLFYLVPLTRKPTGDEACPGPGHGEPCEGTGRKQPRSEMCRPCRDAHDRLHFAWVRCRCGTRRKVPQGESVGWVCEECRGQRRLSL